MTDGGLITLDWQFELDDNLYGEGQDWDNDAEGWAGLFDMVVRDSDEPFELVDGDGAGRDTNAALLITGPLQWMGDPAPGPVLTGVAALRDAWAASNVIRRLHFRLPDQGLGCVEGRRRGVHFDLAGLSVGDVGALVSFKALRPVIVPVP